MPNLLAMSFEGLLAPSIALTENAGKSRVPDGWGLAFYPQGEPCATLLREHVARVESLERELVRHWAQAASSTFILHIREAEWGPISVANTQPFVRSFGGRDWLFAHAGSLKRSPEPEDGPFEPVGSTDTEAVFCVLMNRFAANGWRRIGKADLDVVHGWLQELGQLGPMDIVLADGTDLLVYSDQHGEGRLRLWERRPPYNGRPFGDDDIVVDMFRRGMTSRNGVVVSTEPLFQRDDEDIIGPANMTLLAPGELVVLSQGSVRERRLANPPAQARKPTQRRRGAERAPRRRYAITHRTAYSYEAEVERSAHLLRLTPTQNRVQRLLEHELNVSVAGRTSDYDDVFGNRCRRLLIDDAYSTLVFEARSVVEQLDTDPLQYRPLRARSALPVSLMPWQQQAMQPFLLPPELPESFLHTLTDYAMSFASRNDYDLLETLLDINWTIFEEYDYKPQSTTVLTSAFEVYTQRAGVCQDFTNLMITLARILGVPARYVCGYIYTGPKNPNQVQSEASHAWVQLFLPELGWTGFDPTNGCVTQTEHVQVAVGRNYIDATPTGGTIYVGGGRETLIVDVTVDLLEEG